jgi:hypothetical protein
VELNSVTRALDKWQGSTPHWGNHNSNPAGGPPVATLPTVVRIGNAAAVLCGAHGDVTARARAAACSRQAAYLHADAVLEAVRQARQPGPDREALRQQAADLRRAVAHLRRQEADGVDLGPQRLRGFVACAAAMGLSLNQTEGLRALLLPPGRAPDRSSLGRRVQQAADRAGRLPAVLEAIARPLTDTLCADESFFHGRPVLVGVEPPSFAALLCRRADDRTAATWQQALRPFTGLRQVAHDAGSGLCAGVAAFDARRQRQGQAPLWDGPDLFHTEQEAQCLPGRLWRGVEKLWHRAEDPDSRVGAGQARRRDTRGPQAQARCAGRRAFAALARYEHWGGVWRRGRAALEVFGPDGPLNDRARAEQERAAVCHQLRAGYGKKLRASLRDSRLPVFLDRRHARLAQAESRVEPRTGLAELVRPERAARRGEAGAEGRAAVQRVLCAKRADDRESGYARVAEALSGVVRASSAAECVNSILRVHPGRHRNLTQGLPDLKRLYRNTREFRSGKRRDQCPYERVGLRLPTCDFWELLHKDPAQLTQELSTGKAAA